MKNLICQTCQLSNSIDIKSLHVTAYDQLMERRRPKNMYYKMSNDSWKKVRG